MESFSDYLRANFRRTYWEVAIGFSLFIGGIILVSAVVAIARTASADWAIDGVFVGVFGLTLLLAVASNFVIALLFAPMIAYSKWMRDRYEETLDSSEPDS